MEEIESLIATEAHKLYLVHHVQYSVGTALLGKLSSPEGRWLEDVTELQVLLWILDGSRVQAGSISAKEEVPLGNNTYKEHGLIKSSSIY